MYIYLSKKISVPNNVPITACSWNRRQGYVAAGSEASLVKVIKLEMTEGKDPKSKSQPTNTASLVMNESLEGHTGEITCITWNDMFNKLTTADSNGKIVVWINHDGAWYEEMVNKRDKTIITDMKWSSDGQHICIIYNDGVIILGSLEGNRVWVKELKNTALTNIEWSPDKRLLLFGIANGEVHLYDFNSNYLDKIVIQCPDVYNVKIASIAWYDGQNGFVSPDSPALAICYTNGKCQIMTNETDEKPVIMDCEMDIMCATWNHDGSVLAVGGMQTIDGKDSNIVQFFNPWGQHLKTLKIPGNKLRSCSWEGNSLRIVIAIDSYIYFANMRPSYKWCYFNNTIVYSYTKPTKLEQCVAFYNIKTGENYLKYMKRLLGVVGGGDHCVLISQSEDTSSTGSSIATAAASTNQALSTKSANVLQQYALVLCNAIGTPLETKYIDIQPLFWSMNSTHIIVASKSYFYLWNFQSNIDRNSLKKQTFERLAFIDNPNNSVQMKTDDPSIVSIGSSVMDTKNPITCVALSDKFLFIGRESGIIQKFSLATCTIIDVHMNESNGIVASKIAINSNSTKMAVIDTSSVMRLIDLNQKNQKEEYANFKRTDVWNVLWASDNPDMFVSMEKIKMYIFKDTQPEEPTSCSGYICSFSDLQVKVALLDDLMQRPENPSQTDVLDFDTKSLRVFYDLLEKVNLQEATQFIEQNPHQKLWRLLAEAALNKVDIKVAEHAFVKCKDYYGIEFIKKLQNLNNTELKKAEIAAYFSKFDQAENLYMDMDRKDLALKMRKKLGDWVKVLQLLKTSPGARTVTDSEQVILEHELAQPNSGAGTDVHMEEAFNEIGEHYAERQNWSLAVKYYSAGRNLQKQMECYYVLEDYESLVKVLEQLPENAELLPRLAQMFESIGMCKEACDAFLKSQNVKGAVDCCVRLNQWDEGIRLAKQYNINTVDNLLAKQANIFLEQNKVFNAIELYRKARHYLDAARLMFEVADREAKQRSTPLLIKKIYVLSGLLVEQYRDLVKAGGILPSKVKVAQREQASKALDGILSEESTIAISDSKILDNAWRGAEAYHFMMLCQRQLRAGAIESAFKTSMALMEFEDILNPKHVYSIIALCACGNGSYNAASKAFIKLESNDTIEERDRKEFEALAFQIFSLNSPKDKKPALRGDCPQCGTHITEWSTNCPSCDTKFAPCIVSGRPILEPQFWVCGSCKHRAIEQEIANRISCPLCHMPVR